MSISIKERRALERAVDLLSCAERMKVVKQVGHPGADYETEQRALDAAEQRFRALLDKLSEPDVKR